MTEASPDTNIPSQETIESAAQMKVFDSKGNQVPFGDLFASSKSIVVFTRHSFCWSCQRYVAQLAEIPEKSLSEANVRLVIIGCGQWELIENYKQMAGGFKGDVFVDPSRDLYHKLGMIIMTTSVTPAGQPKRSYADPSFSRKLKGYWNIILNISKFGKQGNVWQNGGDFVFGPGNQCHFAHIMQHTEDHVEVADLMKAAGVRV